MGCAAAAVNAGCLVLVQAIFAGYAVILSAVFIKSSLNPWVYALFRDLLGSALLLCASLFTREVSRPWFPRREDAVLFMTSALLGVWGSQGLNATAVRLTTGSYVSLLQPGQAIVTFVAAVMLNQEPFFLYRWTSYAKLAATVLAVSGAVALIAMSSTSSTGVMQQSKDIFLGTFYLVLQVVCSGLWSPSMKPLLQRYSPIVAVAWVYTLGSVLILLSVLSCATSREDWSFSPPILAAIAYGGVFTSAVNYFLMTWVNSRASPLTVAAFSPLNPVFTIALSWAALGQVPSRSYFIGGSAVVFGVLALIGFQQFELRHESLNRTGVLTLTPGDGIVQSTDREHEKIAPPAIVSMCMSGHAACSSECNTGLPAATESSDRETETGRENDQSRLLSGSSP
jgi:drug/metabolite transporter (DMT)-like permease